MNMEQLAAGVRMYKRNKFKFVQKQFNTSGNGYDGDPHVIKNNARGKVIMRYRSGVWREPLKILTMPSLKWCFERSLLGARKDRPNTSILLEQGIDTKKMSKEEYASWFNNLPRLPTTIVACENSDPIYRISLKHIPKKDATLTATTPITFKTDLVEAYHYKDIFTFMQETDEKFDVAWIDLFGYVSLRRFKIIKEFFKKKIITEIIITSMTARYDLETQAAFAKYKSYEKWLSSFGVVVDRYEYNDGTPFLQLVIRKKNKRIDK